jgi:hypothetical protein
MYRIRIESCENADEGFTFDHETLAECITTSITEFSNAVGWFNVKEMATLLDTIVEAMRKHDDGEPPIAKEWDFSSPEEGYYVVFFEDSEDDDGTPCETIWNEGRPCRDENLPSGIVPDEPVIESKLTIADHNEQLRKVMFDRGCEWKSNAIYEHFTRDGEYEPYPVGYIRGPQFHSNGNHRPYSYSVQGRDGWLQRSFTQPEYLTEGPKWALDTALSVMT